MPVRIVTDSSSGLPEDVVKELDITVVDLHLVSEEGDHQSTSGLSALELTAAYARQLERGGDDGVVALHLSKELSSTWSAAVTAAGVFDGTVQVIDTNSVGMAVGAAAMAAARLALDGAGLDECVDLAQDTLLRSETWLYLHRIDELRKSGRISAATALLSTALATKPIMHLNSGRIELAVKTRTQSKALAKLTELISARAQGEPAFIAIQQYDAKEAARALEEQLQEALAERTSIMITDMEETLAIHCGPGALGVSAVFSSPPPEAAT
ncbi:DegV family protein [Corynebacterium vitaeruminis]|uniref:DegV family protein n=1 Tax=Corynebacterium vitaeruminis TaxID=38305 RepID=UPI0005510CBE|nr:DegV family protein [Corynebacterium vitaeruminis]